MKIEMDKLKPSFFEYRHIVLAFTCVVLLGIWLGRSLVQRTPFVSFVFFISIGALIIITKYRASMYMKKPVLLFLIAFILRAGFAFLMSHIFWYDDEEKYNQWGSEIARVWQAGGHVDFESYLFGGFFKLINGFLYFLLSEHTLNVRFFNAFLGSIMPFLVYDIAKKAYQDIRVARLALYLTIFAPPFIIYTSVQLKDMTVGFFLVLVVWSSLCLRPFWFSLLISLISTGVVFTIRMPYGAMTLAILAVYYVLLYGKKQVIGTVNLLLGLGFGILSVYLITISPLRETLISRYSEETSYKQYEHSEATVKKFLKGGGNPTSPYNIGIVLTRSLFSPSPLRFIKSLGISTGIEALTSSFWYTIVPFWMLSLLITWRTKDDLMINMLALSIFVVSAVSFLGIQAETFRYNIPSLPFFTLMAAHGFYEKKWRRQIVWIWIGLCILFNVIYFLV